MKDGLGVGFPRPARFHTFAFHDRQSAQVSARPYTLCQIRPRICQQVGPEDNRGPDRVGGIPAERLAQGRQRKAERCDLCEHADARQSAQQPIQRVPVRPGRDGELVKVLFAVSQRVGDLEADRSA